MASGGAGADRARGLRGLFRCGSRFLIHCSDVGSLSQSVLFPRVSGTWGMLGADGAMRACCVPSLWSIISLSASRGEASGRIERVDKSFDWQGCPAAAAASPSRTPRRTISVAAFRIASTIPVGCGAPNCRALPLASTSSQSSSRGPVTLPSRDGAGASLGSTPVGGTAGSSSIAFWLF